MIKKKLKGLVYLCGAMEFADDGETWRQEAACILGDYGLDVWDPYEREAIIYNNENIRFIKSACKKYDFIEYREIMKQIVLADLYELENYSTSLLVKYNKDVNSGAGSQAEMSLATLRSIPVHVWLDGLELTDVPGWSIGCIETVSYSLEKAINKLLECPQRQFSNTEDTWRTYLNLG